MKNNSLIQKAVSKQFVKPLVLAASIFVTGCAITPQQITLNERTQSLNAERAALVKDQEALTGPVDLEEAFARAIKYNLDFKVKQMEEALAQKQLDLAHADLLPKLTLGAGYTERDNQNGSSSRSLATGLQSLESSTSQDKQLTNASLGLTWNVLDFGVSYYQGKQQADRFLVAQERRRKAIHQIMQQVRQAYWQAAGAQLLESKIAPVLADAQKALKDSRKIEDEKLRSPLETLNYQRQLLDIIRQLEAVNDELSQAKPRLASLMNLEPGQAYTLAIPEQREVPELKVTLQKMEETALLHRPEIMEARYNKRISVAETHKAMAKLFPGLEFSVGTHYDSNSFLANSHWSDAGLRVSWNLLNLLNASTIKQTAAVQHEIAERQQMALYMAVLTQANVAFREFNGRQRQYALTSEYDSVEQRILNHTRNSARLDAIGKLQEVRVAATALISELRLHQNYSALQGAYGQVLTTMGLDPLPATVASQDLKGLREAVHTMEQTWQTALKDTQ